MANMQAFTIKTNKSDYPFLVIADGFKNAVDVLHQQGIFDTDIISVQQMEYAKSDHILIEGQKAEKGLSIPVNTDELWNNLSFTMGYWYFIDELAKPLDIDGDGYVVELEFKEGCGLHPISIADDSTKITYRSNGACKGWETMTTATIVLKEGKMLDLPLTNTVNHKHVAFILPYKDGNTKCYINTWDGMRRPYVYITNTQIGSKYDATSFIRRIQNVSEDGFDNMIIWK